MSQPSVISNQTQQQSSPTSNKVPIQPSILAQSNIQVQQFQQDGEEPPAPSTQVSAIKKKNMGNSGQQQAQPQTNPVGKPTSMDDFDIISKLGKLILPYFMSGDGAYSSVYKVNRIHDNESYALKKVKLHHLSEKEKENAINEVRILASIKHVNIISYKESFVEPQTQSLCIVMEYADNGDLFQKISDHQKAKTFFQEQEIWKIFIQVVRGLKAMHDLNIMHRDLKSANVFLQKDFTAKLGDMNVSKVANKRGLNYTQTGTPYYASPEVWRDEPYDVKSDIWSLGCVLYEMIALKPPFTADDMQGLFKKVTQGRFPRIPKIYSHDLWTMVKYLLQVNPQSRPNCDQIMNIPTFAKRCEKLFAEESFYNDQNILLKTIKFPKNLMYLSDRLPKQNYSNFNTTEEFDNRQSRKNITMKSYNNGHGSQQQRDLKLPSIQNAKQVVNYGGNSGTTIAQNSYANPLADDDDQNMILAQSPNKKRVPNRQQVPSQINQISGSQTKTLTRTNANDRPSPQNLNQSLNQSLASNGPGDDNSTGGEADPLIEITNQNIYIGKKKHSLQHNTSLEILNEEPPSKMTDKTEQQLILVQSEKKINMQTIDRKQQQQINDQTLPPLNGGEYENASNHQPNDRRNPSPLLLKNKGNHQKLKQSQHQVSISQDYSQKKILAIGHAQSNQQSSNNILPQPQLKLYGGHQPTRPAQNYHRSQAPEIHQLESSDSQDRLKASPARIQEILNRYNIKQLRSSIKYNGVVRNQQGSTTNSNNTSISGLQNKPQQLKYHNPNGGQKYYNPQANVSYGSREEMKGILNHHSSVDLVVGQHMDRSSKVVREMMNNRTINEDNEDEGMSTVAMMKNNMIKMNLQHGPQHHGHHQSYGGGHANQASSVNSSNIVLPKLDNSYNSKHQLQIEQLSQAYRGSIQQSPKNQYEKRGGPQKHYRASHHHSKQHKSISEAVMNI